MKLNIYGKNEAGKKIIVKTYEAETYDLMFGTCEDVANAVKLDDLKPGNDENMEIIKLVGNLIVGSMDTVKGLLKDIFPGVTDADLKQTKVKEIVDVLVDVVRFTIAQLNIGTDAKNAIRGRM